MQVNMRLKALAEIRKALAYRSPRYLVKSHRIYNTEVTWQHMDAVVMIAGGLLLMVMLSMNKKAYRAV